MPGFPERAALQNSCYGSDESPPVGAHIRRRPASGKPWIARLRRNRGLLSAGALAPHPHPQNAAFI